MLSFYMVSLLRMFLEQKYFSKEQLKRKIFLRFKVIFVYLYKYHLFSIK